MKKPKVYFKELSLQENIEFVKWAYFENDEVSNIHEYTIKCFPELKELHSKEEINSTIEKVIQRNYEEQRTLLSSEVKRYNEVWKEYEESYFSMLSDYFKVELPVDKIVAKIGFLPVFPRYLDTFSFSLGTNLEDWKILETISHELLHFFWFEKWKLLHPEISKEEYEAPYLSWQYSEMVTDPILNNEPFSSLFGSVFMEQSYDSFYQLKDKNKVFVMDYLRELYASNKSVEEKMEEGFHYIKSILK